MLFFSYTFQILVTQVLLLLAHTSGTTFHLLCDIILAVDSRQRSINLLKRSLVHLYTFT